MRDSYKFLNMNPLPLLSRAGMALASILLMASCAEKKTTAGSPEFISGKQAVELVNPFIGTAPLTDPKQIGYTPPEGWRVWAGLTYPGASLPNAMVQLSPITEYGSGAGYEYEDEEILAFAHTNKGHWNLVHIPILPVSGAASVPFKSRFSHEREDASPGYYQVYLEDYDVDVRLTTSLRGRIHEYNFGEVENPQILFDLGKANNPVSDWNIQKEGERTISGFQRVGSIIVHFHAQVSHPVGELEVVDVGERSGYALAPITEMDGEPVTMKIGLSFVSTDNAAENLER